MISAIIAKLEGVKPHRHRGADGYLAKCPAHADRTPSLSIREDNGTILMRCFAGCTVTEIVQAAGIEWRHMFPPDVGDRRPLRWHETSRGREMAQAMWRELTICEIMESQRESAAKITAADLAREALARERLVAFSRIYGQSALKELPHVALR